MTFVRDIELGRVYWRAAVRAYYLVTSTEVTSSCVRISWVKLDGENAGVQEHVSYASDGLYDIQLTA